MKPLSILIADDEELNRAFVVVLLENRGHTCTCVENGREALEAWRTGRFDCILMDLQMPIMNGEAAAAGIRAEETAGTHVSIIALTSRCQEHSHDQLLLAGFDGYLPKPLEVDHMFALLGKLCPEEQYSAKCISAGGGVTLATLSSCPIEVHSGIDLATGIDRLDGDRDFYLMLLREFREKYCDVVDTISDSLATGDDANAKQIIHALKGAAGYLSLPDVYGVSAKLEQYLFDTGDDAWLQENLTALKNALSQVFASSATLS